MKKAERSARTVDTPSGGSGRGVTNRSRVLSWSAWSGRGNLLLLGFGRNRSIGGGEGGGRRANLNEACHGGKHATHVRVVHCIRVLRARDDNWTHEVRASPQNLRDRLLHEVDTFYEEDGGGECEPGLGRRHWSVGAEKAWFDPVLRESALQPLKRRGEQCRVRAREVQATATVNAFLTEPPDVRAQGARYDIGHARERRKGGLLRAFLVFDRQVVP